eukprot:m.222644 g.222644  ORF g.222644 m.222644 type:complete len:473 (+) comp33380_c0_seq1:353-1771(+)
MELIELKVEQIEDDLPLPLLLQDLASPTRMLDNLLDGAPLQQQLTLASTQQSQQQAFLLPQQQPQQSINYNTHNNNLLPKTKPKAKSKSSAKGKALSTTTSSRPIATSTSLLNPPSSIPCTEIKLPRSELAEIPQAAFDSAKHLHFLNLNRNNISFVPDKVQMFTSLVELNLGRNEISELPREFTLLTSLVRLDLSGNRLRKLPQGFSRLKGLQQLQLNGNELTELSEDVFELPMLIKLYVGANKVQVLPERIRRLKNLQVLYLGGNLLSRLPSSITTLINLEMLYLGDNQLSMLPERFCELKSLRTLNLHNNRFEYLPEGLVNMSGLQNLSLRGNPLVTKFINDDEAREQPLSLMELAGRVVKLQRIKYDTKAVPAEVKHFLNNAQQCNNPACAGVYFQSSVKNLQVVDFCGKFRVPLIKFLCKSKCVGDEAAYPTCKIIKPDPCAKKMKRILLDNYQGIKCDCIACSADS